MEMCFHLEKELLPIFSFVSCTWKMLWCHKRCHILSGSVTGLQTRQPGNHGDGLKTILSQGKMSFLPTGFHQKCRAPVLKLALTFRISLTLLQKPAHCLFIKRMAWQLNHISHNPCCFPSRTARCFLCLNYFAVISLRSSLHWPRPLLPVYKHWLMTPQSLNKLVAVIDPRAGLCYAPGHIH